MEKEQTKMLKKIGQLTLERDLSTANEIGFGLLSQM